MSRPRVRVPSPAPTPCGPSDPGARPAPSFTFSSRTAITGLTATLRSPDRGLRNPSGGTHGYLVGGAWQRLDAFAGIMLIISGALDVVSGLWALDHKGTAQDLLLYENK